MVLSQSKLTIIACGVTVLAVSFLLQSERPKVWAADKVPIAFWAWRTEAPTNADVQDAFNATNAKILFLRAGQLDFSDGEVKRIHSVAGTLPSTPELHLVYNGTRKLLGEFEQIETGKIAAAVADTYRSDLEGADTENTRIKGIQLDLDVPTRLLSKYADVLRAVHELLPPDAILSITGLPTWADSKDIYPVLDAIDFWVPQCYGADIPTRITERIPISSSKAVARTIAKIRKLRKPFYAGLSAYSYAILYGRDGSLIELRGDIDPSLASSQNDLELTGRRTFNGDAETGEIRYEYRAKSDVVLDGLIIRSGETLVFDLPTTTSLRAAARAVRENAGDSLLGICLFRLPTADDKTTLGLGEIVSALTDTKSTVGTKITLKENADNRLSLQAVNTGNAVTGLSDDALVIDLELPAGSIDGVIGVAGFTAYETLCRRDTIETARPCSERRANLIRLKAKAWKTGSVAMITFSAKNNIRSVLSAIAKTRMDDGRIEKESFDLQISE